MKPQGFSLGRGNSGGILAIKADVLLPSASRLLGLRGLSPCLAHKVELCLCFFKIASSLFS